MCIVGGRGGGTIPEPGPSPAPREGCACQADRAAVSEQDWEVVSGDWGQLQLSPYIRAIFMPSLAPLFRGSHWSLP